MTIPKEPIRVVLDYTELLATPKMMRLFTQQCYTTRGVYMDAEEAWLAFQSLLGEMVSDPDFNDDDAEAYPNVVVVGLTEEDDFYIYLDNGVELSSHITFLSRENIEDDVQEALKITRVIMHQLPKEYEGLMFDRPLYPSEVDKEGRIFGELLNSSGIPKVLVEYHVDSGKVIFEGMESET